MAKSSRSRAKATHTSGRAADPELTPRVARRERRRARSREEILAAAHRVLLREGIQGTTLEVVASEVGLTKAALYYYFPSKDALLFEIVYSTVEEQALAISAAVAHASNGGEALVAIIRETVRMFSSRLDDFRLTFLHNQVAGPGKVTVTEQQLARIRPLNDLAFARAAKLLSDERKTKRGRARVDPRMMAFLAQVAAIGLLTMKGMVEAVGDPLRYSDEQMIDALAQIFAAAAAP